MTRVDYAMSEEKISLVGLKGLKPFLGNLKVLTRAFTIHFCAIKSKPLKELLNFRISFDKVIKSEIKVSG